MRNGGVKGFLKIEEMLTRGKEIVGHGVAREAETSPITRSSPHIGM